MTVRELFFDSMRRKSEKYVPFDMGLCPALLDKCKDIIGTTDYHNYFGTPVRAVRAEFKGSVDKFYKYYNMNDVVFDNNKDWGVGRVYGDVAHFSNMVHPMENFEAIEEFENYPYPDPVADYDWEIVKEKIKEIKGQDCIAFGILGTTIYEISWYLRGMEKLMVDMYINPELAHYHLERITGIRCECARRYALTGCDVLRLGDDVATQQDMMMNPDTWREFLKPRLERVIKAAKEAKPDILVFYHSDGNVQKIIPELIEIGVDILNPIQPECMDPVEIKRLYGDRLSFWGTLGTQTTMPFGSVQEVRDVCLKMILEVGKGGGLLLAPSHTLEPEVPWENIMAFLDTVKKYNGF